MGTPLKLKLFYSDVDDNPSEYDSWKLYSFSRKHVNYRHLDNFLPPGLGLRRKLEVGTAFLLSYYEHGQCVWSLQDEGPQCRWDTVNCAGILLWEQSPKNLGAKTLEARREDARQFLKTYTAWCNGECFGYILYEGNTEDEEVDSCSGFYDPEEMAESVRLAAEGRRVEIVPTNGGSDASSLADSYEFGQNVIEPVVRCPKCRAPMRSCSTGDQDAHCDSCLTVVPLERKNS